MSVPSSGENRLAIAAALVLLAVAMAAQWFDTPYVVTLVTRATIFAIAGIGLNIALGLGGLVSLGHALFFGIGGYAMGILASHAQDGTLLAIGSLTFAGSTFMPTIWLVAVLSSTVAALLVGLLALRTTGAYFIMITLAFGEMLYWFAISWPTYGGEDGLLVYRRNTFPAIDTLQPIGFFAIVFAVLLLVLLLASRLADSPFGLALKAVRRTPARVAAIGVHPFRIRLAAFVISGAITGLAGALFADLNRFVSPAMFSWQTSGEIMIFVILGGVGRLAGPVLGAGLFVLLEHVLGDLSEYWHVHLGFLLLAVVLFARRGLAGLLDRQAASHG